MGAYSAVGPQDAPSLRWQVDSGAAITARPRIVTDGGRSIAYVGNHAGRFIGVVSDGPGAGTIELSLDLGGIVWSTAAVDARGYLYVGADDDVLYAIDPSRRAIVWKKRLGDCQEPRAPGPEGVRCDVDGGPTIGPDGSIYVGADGVYRLDRDGEIVWHVPGAHVRGAPVVTADGLVLFGAQDGTITAANTKGQVQWRYAVGPDVDASMAVTRDGTIVAGADDGKVYALSPSGALAWTYQTGRDIRGDLAVDGNDTVYVPSFDGRLYALTSTGQLRFLVPTLAPIASAPVLDADGNVYFGSRDDRLYAVSGAGEAKWTLELPADIDAAVSITPAGMLIVAADDGVLRGLQ